MPWVLVITMVFGVGMRDGCDENVVRGVGTDHIWSFLWSGYAYTDHDLGKK